MGARSFKYYDYHPFGMIQPGRSYSSSSYRYGFNGQEKDDEIKGSGNSYDFGARMLDVRLGKFLSTDPLAKSYPMLTPYQFASNTPIRAIDVDGLEALITIHSNWYTKRIMKAYDAGDVEEALRLTYRAIESKGQDKWQRGKLQENGASNSSEAANIYNGEDGNDMIIVNGSKGRSIKFINDQSGQSSIEPGEKSIFTKIRERVAKWERENGTTNQGVNSHLDGQDGSNETGKYNDWNMKLPWDAKTPARTTGEDSIFINEEGDTVMSPIYDNGKIGPKSIIEADSAAKEDFKKGKTRTEKK